MLGLPGLGSLCPSTATGEALGAVSLTRFLSFPAEHRHHQFQQQLERWAGLLRPAAHLPPRAHPLPGAQQPGQGAGTRMQRRGPSGGTGAGCQFTPWLMTQAQGLVRKVVWAAPPTPGQAPPYPARTGPVRFSSVAQSCPTPGSHGLQHPGLPVRHQLPEFTQTHAHPVGDAIQPSHLCRPLFLLPSIFPSIRAFSSESVLIRWPKYWSFNFSISPSNEHPGLISFRMDWLDLLTVQGTLKSLLQHHSSKASVLRGSAFFMVQLSHPHMTTGKTIALTRQTFVGKVMSAF